MVLEKRKLNLLTDSVACSCFCSCSASHYFIEILDREDQNRIELFVSVLQWEFGFKYVLG